MKERPILFSAPMVRALIDGSKTQTRRIVKLPHENTLGQWESTTIGGELGGLTAAGDEIPLQGAIWHTRTGDCLTSPHGQPGGHLYVRETWRTTGDGGRADYLAPRNIQPHPVWYDADGAAPADQCAGKTRVSIHMPRWASRILLEIVSVRVERLQEISEADAVAEGIEKWGDPHPRRGQRWNCPPHVQRFGEGDNVEDACFDGGPVNDPREAYRGLWASINGAGSWEANPWVWVSDFKRVTP